VRRIAVLPFENLTGDASFDWVRNAGPAMLGDELAGSAHVSAVSAGTLADARAAGVPQVLHTYYTRERGELKLNFEIEDAASLRIGPAASPPGPLLAAVDDLAHRLDPQAHEFSTSNAAAVEAWGTGAFERAVELDPDFGAAWLAWVRSLAQAGKSQEALSLAGRALGRKTLRSDWNRAQLGVLIATIRNDVPGRAAALAALANLAPADASTLTAAAEAYNLARNFQASAVWYRKALVVDPSNAGAMNLLGYAEGYAGNVEAARKIFDTYGKQPGMRVNSHDSLGEVYFMNGRFHEAEREFLEATALDPSFLAGAPFVKAAYAHWDLPGADAMFQKFVATAATKDPALAAWREATWLYATGRPERAVAMLSKAPADDRIRRQLAVWKNAAPPPSGLENLRASYEATPPALDGAQRVFYGSALAEAGKPAEARAILARWPLPENSAEPEIDTLVFPKYLELRKKLQLNR
jgi:tetratricopeptide (TPR) repeat protein